MLINPYRLATGSSFSPASLSNLEIWLDASDTSTLYNAATGGSLSANGALVRRIEDKSGNGRHFSQAGTPDTVIGVRVSAGLNGRSTVETQTGQTSSVGYNNSNTITLAQQTVIMVFATRSSDTTLRHYFSQGTSFDTELSGGVFPLYGTNGAADGFTVRANGGDRALLSFNVDEWKRRSVVIGASEIVHRWGSSSATYTFSQASRSYTRFGLLGATSTGRSQPYRFAELLMYSRALTSTELSDIDTYITNKWGSGLV